MNTRRKTLRLQPHEDRQLRHIYKAYRIPIDQYIYRPAERERFVGQWNSLTGRHDTADELLHYMRTRRKDNKGALAGWVTFDGKHMRQPGVALPELAAEQWIVFDEIYVAIGIASDNYVGDDNLLRQFSATLAGRIGRSIDIDDLMIMLICRRKDGFLPTIAKKSELGFGDIDQIAG